VHFDVHDSGALSMDSALPEPYLYDWVLCMHHQDIKLAVRLCGPKCELYTQPGGHFDVYDIVPKVIGKYIDFIVANLH